MTRPLIDKYGRHVSYLRVSVTDRCDFRCTYCMAESMIFLPKSEVLTLEELDQLCSAFIARGVRKLRLTGGEPLVRRGIMDLIRDLSRHLKSSALDELTMTTNGSQLATYADDLARLGVKRLNISLDSLDHQKFAEITRRGRLEQVLSGLEAAKQAGIKIKINTVALRNFNEDEISSLVAWCGKEGFDLCLIETMPLGDIDGDRTDQYLPLTAVRERLAQEYTLVPSNHVTPGPARYVTVAETGGRLGFITPLTHNFCEGCNRVRVTCTGTLYMCLGQEDHVDLRAALLSGEPEALDRLLDEAMQFKPKGHDFVIDRKGQKPAVGRHMSMTGG
ncbi:MAG: GTP 3',8-cyclase MoaA [Thalassospira sp.]|uniref:GTP 3',8-cyclase MoaA n=1 Tax=Thalassospira sp. TaxID=1912094 RepID=UPI000C5794C7|nr:GTP 3',8-cyclase MoaA [Thalassospira sp.]MAZ35816.1 GTP 3',8-cyclase MoaA [Thalassospira sp.]